MGPALWHAHAGPCNPQCLRIYGGWGENGALDRTPLKPSEKLQMGPLRRLERRREKTR